MKFLLSAQNLREYLVQQRLHISNNQNIQIESKVSKNFNLLVTLPDKQRLFVKQESQNSKGKTSGQFLKEWRIREWLENFPELSKISHLLSKALLFDKENSILIFNYRDDYQDLEDISYIEENDDSSLKIAGQIGSSLAKIHQATIDRENYRLFLAKDLTTVERKPSFIRGLKRVRPDVFRQVISENLKFFKLYQRASELRASIQSLINNYQPRCLIHNDLKFDNILLHNDYLHDYDNSTNPIIVIDWEKFAWGDPAYDLGKLIACHLNKWLSSIIISGEIDIQTALKLATIPLEKVQPSIANMAICYLKPFPEILNIYPNFWQRVIQFAGMSLIERIQIKIHYHEPIGNTGICMLQVAQSLLCYPEFSIKVIFGEQARKIFAFQ
ncbi:MAG: aminoglycoside phosphotransferase family protein [Rivularia sp. (in: cyanobacteria)]